MFMKKHLPVLGLLFALISCDDGEAIVTDFKFDAESDLNLCSTDEQNILYIVNTDPDESISFAFSDEDFDGTIPTDEEEEDEITQIVELSNSNQLVYRTYNDQLEGKEYFCSGVPPNEPKITDEYKSIDGGYIQMITILVDEDVDELANTVTKTFETHVQAKDITLENPIKDEEIVQETLQLGYFTKTTTIDL